ncbi:zinc finger SWIM domain-containing protein 7 isoform X4 [Gopherus flavomarginatus]|uniref:zinc finger SWIM domain-containing protein 7 isoform X4 n=1 Tax=Gopherus flavomarginatus TaxID=286002 RepID=UPI0021CBA73E|nr:zinc finger SWIM domain-containing protein 7 isoform X4 [Gopherus flavomarginatus]
MDPPGRHPTKLAILISQHTVRPCREVRLSVEEDGGHFACSSRGAFERDKKGFPGDLAWLKFVFGSSAVAALDLVDQHSVTRIVSPSGRAVYQNSVAACPAVCKQFKMLMWKCLLSSWA